jgi:hypothetical protein
MSFFYNRKLRPAGEPDREMTATTSQQILPSEFVRLKPDLPGEPTVAKTATKTGAKRCSTKNVKKGAAKCAGESDVTIDRRRESSRREEVAEIEEDIAAPKLERREKVNRRRQIDPTTCERDYTDTEVEFMNALDEYKRKSGRMFPTCSEVLEVIHSLGYVKLTSAQMTSVQATGPTAASAKPMLGDLQVTAEIETLVAAAKELG